MARTIRFGRAGLMLFTALTAAACGDSPTPVTPTVPAALVLTCPADVNAVSTDGQAVTVTFPNPIVLGATGGVTLSCSAPSGSAFPVGATQVICTASDARSASGQCGFSISVTLPPPRIGSTKFLAFGDSLTEGLTSSSYLPLLLGPAESYPTRLQLLLSERYSAQSIVVTNAGLSGEWASDGVIRLPGVLSQHAPQVLLLLEGANDLNFWGRSGISRAAAALDAMVAEASRRNIRVFLATMPPWRNGGPKDRDASLVPLINVQIRRIAADRGAVLVDLFAAVEPDMNTLIGADGLHPTEAGYQRMAEAFFQVIVPALEVPTAR